MEKWNKNYKVYSQTKSKNKKVLSIYDLILKNWDMDSDWWSIIGNTDIHCRLDEFTRTDWKELKIDIHNWKSDQIEILSIALMDKHLDTYNSKDEEIKSWIGHIFLVTFIIIDFKLSPHLLDLDLDEIQLKYIFENKFNSKDFIHRAETRINKIHQLPNFKLSAFFDKYKPC